MRCTPRVDGRKRQTGEHEPQRAAPWQDYGREATPAGDVHLLAADKHNALPGHELLGDDGAKATKEVPAAVDHHGVLEHYGELFAHTRHTPHNTHTDIQSPSAQAAAPTPHADHPAPATAASSHCTRTSLSTGSESPARRRGWPLATQLGVLPPAVHTHSRSSPRGSARALRPAASPPHTPPSAMHTRPGSSSTRSRA